MGEIANHIGELVIVSLDKLFPGEGGIFCFGSYGGQVVTHSIGLEQLQNLFGCDSYSSGFGELLSLEVEKFIRGYR